MSATQDASAIIQAFDATCNDGNLDEVMAFFAEDAVVRQVPPPPDGGIYRGKKQIRAWFEPQMAGFHVDSAGREANGDTVTWNARVIFDLLRHMGLNQPVDAQCEAVVRGGKIASWTVTNHAAAGQTPQSPAHTGEAKMSGSENKALVRSFIEEVWNKGNPSAASAFMATDLVDHDPGFPGQPPGREGYEQLAQAVLQAFPDLQCTIDTQIAEGDLVVTRFTDQYTNTGPLWNLPATGKRAVMSGINIDRIVEGKIVETWHIEDRWGLMQQLGVIPAR